MPIDMRPQSRSSRRAVLRRRVSTRRSRGITLIEHMIALAITAVTVTIGYPGYSEFVRRGWMQDAMTTLAGFAQRMEAAYDGNGNGALAATGIAYSLDNTGAQRTTSWSGSAVSRACWLVRGTEC